jgi:hypothetical protein
VKQQKLLVVLGLPFVNLPHLSRRGPTSFKRRFLEDFEESLPVLVKTMIFYLKPFLGRSSLSARMGVIPHLPISVPHVEKLADLPVLLLLPLFSLTSPRTIQGGLASSTVLELDIQIRRRHGATDDAALGHDYCCSRIRVA